MSKVALIFGHSFTKRMERYLTLKPLDLNQQYSYIFTQGIPGATVETLTDHIEFIRDVDPCVLLLDLGSNDLCDPNVSHFTYSRQLISLIGKLLYSSDIPSLKMVVVLPILHRGTSWQPRSGQRNLVQFNQVVTLSNQLIREQADTLPGIHFYWSDKFPKTPVNLEKYLQDGVHLKPQALQKYRKVYRGALIQGFNRASLPSFPSDTDTSAL